MGEEQAGSMLGGAGGRGPTGAPLIGRDDEMRALIDALEACAGGARRLALLGGDPGIGKTRVVSEFAERAASAGANVVWGRCWEAGGAPAYWPWTQAVRTLTSGVDAEIIASWIASAGAAAAAIPGLSANDSSTATDAYPASDEDRFRMFDAFDRFLTLAAGDRPIVILLEDVHAADAPSMLLLRFMAGRSDPARIMIAATYRTSEVTREHPLSAGLHDLGRSIGTTTITMRGLDPPDLGRLLDAFGTSAPAHVVESLHRSTDGNPLFVGEIVRLLAAEGQAWDELDVRRWPLPEGVRETISRRVGQLPASCRELLVAGSVMGRDIDLGVLAQVAGRGVEAVLRDLLPAVEGTVLDEVPGSPGMLRFGHALMRDALYAELAPADRMALHGAVGAALEQRYAGDLGAHADELAHHFLQMGPAGVSDAVRHAITAGERAVRMLAYEEGARSFRLALGALRHPGDDERRCRLLLLLGDAERRAGNTEAAREAFLQASDIAKKLGEVEHIVDAALGYAWRYVWARAGRDHVLIPMLEHALEVMPPDDDPRRAMLLARLSGARRDDADFEPRVALATEAVEMARRLGDPTALAFALLAWWAAAYSPDQDQAVHLAIAEEIESLQERTGPELLMYTQWIRIARDLTLGEMWAAREREEALGSMASELRQPSDRFWAVLMSVVVALHHGRFADAEHLIEEMEVAGGQAQAEDAAASRLFALFAVRREQGRLAELEEDLRRGPARHPGYRATRCVLLTALCELGRDVEARSLFERLIADFEHWLHDNEFLSVLTLLGEATVAIGAHDHAGRLIEAMRPYQDLMGSIGWETPTGPVARPLGMVLASVGRLDEAVEALAHAVDVAERAGARPYVGHARLELADVLARRGAHGDRARAHEEATRAAEIAADLGMPVLAGRAAELLARLGGRGDRRGRTGRAAALTPREREVAGLIAEGLSNRAIAERLYVSERTAETHVQNILTKLGFSSRAQIAGWIARGTDDASALPT